MLIKAITIWQPWAWLIIKGIKPVENRDWATHYRGPLAIHAGKKWDFYGASWIKTHFSRVEMPHRDDFVFGAVIGKVKMIDCVSNHESFWFVGPWGHVYSDPEEFAQPITAKGKLGLWDWDDVSGPSA